MGKRIRFKFSKTGPFIYLSHLDIINIIARALRRSKIMVEYSKGFNPKPKITFSPPIPLGIDSLAEYADVNLADDIDAEELSSRLNASLHKKIIISKAAELPEGAKNLMSQVDIVQYRVEIDGSIGGAGQIREYVNLAEKNSGLKGSVFELEISKAEDKECSSMLLEVYGHTKTSRDQDHRVFKARDFLESLRSTLSARNIGIKRVIKNELYILKDNKKLTPFEVLQSFV